MRAVLALLPLLLFTAPAGAEPAWIGPADTGSASSNALGPIRTGTPSGSPAPRTVTPNPPSPGPAPSSTPTTSQPSEACRKFPNLC